MKVLIVGSGGREHALAWKIAKSPKVDKIYCAPGNGGIGEYAECVDIKAMEFEKLASFAKEKQIDLTVVGKNLVFYVLEDFSQLEQGYFGIEEPARGERACREDALMIVPGVAFDPQRHRIGYGQGFYDRYLSVHREHTTFAVAFDFQVLNRVPAEAADICPSLLITESRTY